MLLRCALIFCYHNFNLMSNFTMKPETPLTKPLLVSNPTNVHYTEIKSEALVHLENKGDSKRPNNNDRLLYSRHEEYAWSEIGLDVFLFLLAAWSQFGSSFFFQETAFESANDPLERFVYVHLSVTLANKIKNYLSSITQALSFADAICTAGTYINMRNCRREFMRGIRKGLSDYEKGNISSKSFVINTFLIFSTFIIGAFMPWVGLQETNYSDRAKISFSITMMVGLIISYIMSNAPYLFSATKQFSDFFKLSWEQKKEILGNIFLTRKGLMGFLPRALINAVNRSWTFFGVSRLIEASVFHTSSRYICYPFTTLSTVSSGYQTLMSQGVNDYKLTFGGSSSMSEHAVILVNNKTYQTSCRQKASRVVTLLLWILIIGVFILRTLSVPSLYTGKVEDPANNYSKTDAFLSSLGLLFGGYAALQYSRFRYSRWQDNLSAFFRPDNRVSAPTEVKDSVVNQSRSFEQLKDEKASGHKNSEKSITPFWSESASSAANHNLASPADVSYNNLSNSSN